MDRGEPSRSRGDCVLPRSAGQPTVDVRLEHGSGPREVAEAVLALRALTDVGDARLDQAQQLARVEADAVAMIARRAQDPLAVQQPDVDDLRHRERLTEGRERADLEARKGALDLLLGR